MSALRFSIIQTPLFWEQKDANLAMFTQKIESLTGQGGIIILPEMFSTGFSMRPKDMAEDMDGPSVTWMRTTAAASKSIITGSLIIKEDKKFYNRLIWMQPDGNCGWYNKRHLFGYANEHLHYTAGNSRLIASANQFKINLQVCYDLRFPIWARQQNKGGAAPEYDVLIYVANWPHKRSHAWKTLLCARAIENQCYVIGVNRIGDDGNGIAHSGDSMIVSPLGDILYSCGDKEEIYTATLQKTDLLEVRQRFPFLQDGDAFTIT